jgi:hypothetical protein
MRLLLEHLEVEPPFARDPFYLQLEAMAGGAAAGAAVDAALTAAAAAAATGASSRTPPPPAAARPVPVCSSSPGPAAAAAAAAVPVAGGFTACGYPLTGPDLMATRLADIHPASWFALAWYPVYRIPDAPLTARFLAFYSFSQLQEVLQGALGPRAAGGGGGGGGGPDAAAPCRLVGLPMPVVGLKWHNTFSERWLDVLASNADGAASFVDGSAGDAGSDHSSGAASTSSSSSSSSGSSGSGSGSTGSSGSSGTGGVQVVRVSQAREQAWAARLGELQATAQRMSKGSGLKMLTPQGSREVRLYHSDFAFFCARSS